MDDHTNMVSDGSICYFCPSLCIYLTNDNDNVNVNEQRGKGSVHVLLLLLIPLLVLCTSMNVLKFVWIRTRYSISFSQGCLFQYRMNGYSITLLRCLFQYPFWNPIDHDDGIASFLDVCFSTDHIFLDSFCS